MKTLLRQACALMMLSCISLPIALEANETTAPVIVVYLTESKVSGLLRRQDRQDHCWSQRFSQQFSQKLSMKSCLYANNTSSSVIDETGNRFNCKGALWYDLTCAGNPGSRSPSSDDSATLLIDVSQSMRQYDPLRKIGTASTCTRAELLKQLKQSGINVRAFGHADNLEPQIKFKSMDDPGLAQAACKANGDNNATRVLQNALQAHSNPKRPIIMLTDASEQTPHLSDFLRKLGGAKEIFIDPDGLVGRILLLLR